jgi:SAM-dependent methyltransferase
LYDKVSPSYVDLSQENIDPNRLWCQSTHKFPAFQQWWATCQQLLLQGKGPWSLLDIGCGTGGFLRYAQAQGLGVYGFDASQAQVEYARKDLANVRPATSIPEFLASLDNPGMKFDIVTLWDVLEHIRKPLEFLSSVREILKPGSLLFISVPNGRAMLWKRKIYRLIGQNHDYDWVPWEHVFYYSLNSLVDYLQRSSFEVIQSGAVKCYPRPWSLFELLRRLGFCVFSVLPSQSPQIYAFARKPF